MKSVKLQFSSTYFLYNCIQSIIEKPVEFQINYNITVRVFRYYWMQVNRQTWWSIETNLVKG